MGNIKQTETLYLITTIIFSGVLVHPYDNYNVIAGQATIGKLIILTV